MNGLVLQLENLLHRQKHELNLVFGLRNFEDEGFPVDGSACGHQTSAVFILKDVVRRHRIRNVHDLRGLYTLMLHSVTSRFSNDGFLAAKKVSTSPDRGRLLENLVFIELVRRGFDPGFNLFYFVTQSGYEVDFLTRTDGKTDQLIQVTWRMSDAKTREREIRSLLGAAQEMNVATVREWLLTGE